MVWNHAEDAFQARFDRCAKLDRDELALIRQIVAKTMSDDETLARVIGYAIDADGTILPRLLQLVGLTRNKIVQDIKAYVRASRLRVSTSSGQAIFNHPQGRPLATMYLAQQVRRVFGPASGKVSDAMLETLNQATLPGYIRQERAKRMGHEAEYRLACLFRDCGLGFAPEEKAENPLCRAAVIDGMSYDLVSPSLNNARLRVVSTVHTANIGQYGESKDELEIRKAIAAMKRAGDRQSTVLLAFVDGVGFESNRAGLDGVLSQADEFCQFATIWKAAAIAAHLVGKTCRLALDPEAYARFDDFFERYPVELKPITASVRSAKSWIEAGAGWVWVS